MRMSMMKLLILLMMSVLTLTGCGDILGTKVIKKELDTGAFRADCYLDVNEFSNILYRNIEGQIDCLGQNLNLFIRVVKSDRPGYMNRKAFEAYLTKYENDINPDVVRALKAVYDINYLITGDDPDYISKENVDKIIQFAKIFNYEAALNFGLIFQSEEPTTITKHNAYKERVRISSLKMMASLENIFQESTNGKSREINILTLLESFTTDQTREYIEKIEKVLFVKKVLVGGKKDTLTDKEIKRLLSNFPPLATIALDIVKYKFIILDQSSIISLLKSDVESLRNIVFQNMGDRDKEFFFSYDEAVEVVRMFISENDFNIKDFETLIKEAKRLVMGGNDTEVKGLDFRNLLTHANILLSRGEIFHRFYSHFQIPLESRLPLEINYNAHKDTFPGHENDLKIFIRVIKNYRFFKGEFETAYYTRDYWRNPDGVYEIALYEYLIDLVMKEYGSPVPTGSSGVFSHGMDQCQVQNLIVKLKDELIRLKILLPRRAVSISDTVSLLGTLFQYQSDKNGVLDVNEATEFGISLITSMSLAEQMMNRYEKQCEPDQFGRIPGKCFRDNFFQNLCEDYYSYFPLLFDSIGVKKCEDLASITLDHKFIAQYLDVSIRAARLCMKYEPTDTEEIPYPEGDIFTILVAMMHIEATVLRWDDKNGNKNNLMDASEVNAAYEIYSPALDGFLKDMPYVKPFKKQIYQYLIKYEEIPDVKNFGSIWRFLKFMVSFNYKSPATRKTLASILLNVSEQSAKLRENDPAPKFECTWLKDPDNIPAEDENTPVPVCGSTTGATPTTASPNYSALLEMIEVKKDSSGNERVEVRGDGCLEVDGMTQCLNDKDDVQMEEPNPVAPKKKICFTLFRKQICL